VVSKSQYRKKESRSGYRCSLSYLGDTAAAGADEDRMQGLLLRIFACMLICIIVNVDAFLVAKLPSKISIDVRSSLPLRAVPELLVVDPNYNLAAGAAILGTVAGGLEDVTKPIAKGLVAKIFGAAAILGVIFGAFVAYQTTTLRFQFDDSAFSLVKADGENLGENVVVGGENRWQYKSFVNYDFLPSEQFPILVYFKETQTPREAWVEAPIVVDSLEGQAHFFPAISDVSQLKANFASHGCAKAAAK